MGSSEDCWLFEMLWATGQDQRRGGSTFIEHLQVPSTVLRALIYTKYFPLWCCCHGGCRVVVRDCPVHCRVLAPSLISTHQTPVAPTLWVVTAINVCRHCWMSLGWGEELSWWRTTYLNYPTELNNSQQPSKVTSLTSSRCQVHAAVHADLGGSLLVHHSGFHLASRAPTYSLCQWLSRLHRKPASSASSRVPSLHETQTESTGLGKLKPRSTGLWPTSLLPSLIREYLLKP